ncbi:MAG: HAD hydrolase family protein [Chitinophagaceae bacterium]|nr:HAD hydrolase family protein [Chitinophagaceae bacterium]
MEKSIKDIFVFDVDGTLLPPSGNKFDEESKTALTSVSKYGDVILASARPLQGIENLFLKEEIKINHIIALNGALTATENKISKRFPIASGIVNYFISNSNAFNNLWFFTENVWYSSNLNSKEYSVERNAVSFDAVSMDNYQQESVLKITIVSKSEINSTIQQLKSISEEIEITTSNDSYFEIQSNKTNKFWQAKNCLLIQMFGFFLLVIQTMILNF